MNRLTNGAIRPGVFVAVAVGLLAVTAVFNLMDKGESIDVTAVPIDPAARTETAALDVVDGWLKDVALSSSFAIELEDENAWYAASSADESVFDVAGEQREAEPGMAHLAGALASDMELFNADEGTGTAEAVVVRAMSTAETIPESRWEIHEVDVVFDELDARWKIQAHRFAVLPAPSVGAYTQIIPDHDSFAAIVAEVTP